MKHQTNRYICSSEQKTRIIKQQRRTIQRQKYILAVTQKKLNLLSELIINALNLNDKK